MSPLRPADDWADLPAPLTSAVRRLERAVEHLETLQTQLDAWHSLEPCVVVHDFDRSAALFLAKVSLRQAPPARIGIIAGDVVHSLRSALDNLIFGLAELHTGERLSGRDAQASEFPIFGPRAPSSAEWQRKIGVLRPAAQECVLALQPFHHEDEYPLHPLWRIHEIDRLDKHRSPPIAAVAAQNEKIGPHPFGVTIGPAALGGPPVEVRQGEQTVIGRYRAVEAGTNRLVALNLVVTVSVVLGEGLSGGNAVLPFLRGLERYVSQEVFCPLLRSHT